MILFVDLLGTNAGRVVVRIRKRLGQRGHEDPSRDSRPQGTRNISRGDEHMIIFTMWYWCCFVVSVAVQLQAGAHALFA